MVNECAAVGGRRACGATRKRPDWRWVALGLAVGWLSCVAWAQRQTDVQPAMQQSFAAIAPAAVISDVTMTGTVRSIAGSRDESGTITLKAKTGGYSRVEMNLGSQPRVETFAPDEHGQVRGAWSHAGGSARAVAQHNAMTPPDWFFPAMVVGRLLAAGAPVVTPAATQAMGSGTAIRYSASPALDQVPGKSRLLQHLGEYDVDLDPETRLPVVLRFNIHPDRNATVDIPVEIRYSD